MICWGKYAAALNLTNLPNLLPESSNTDISVFFDVGNVWGVDYDSSLDDINELRASTGLLRTGYLPWTMSFVLSNIKL